MQIETPRRTGTARKSMQVEGFEISAWRDADGLMRMEIRGLPGQDVSQRQSRPEQPCHTDAEHVPPVETVAIGVHVTHFILLMS